MFVYEMFSGNYVLDKEFIFATCPKSSIFSLSYQFFKKIVFQLVFMCFCETFVSFFVVFYPAILKRIFFAFSAWFAKLLCVCAGSLSSLFAVYGDRLN